MSKRKNFPIHLKHEFMSWASTRKGYSVSGPNGIYEVFRLLNQKKGEILIAHRDLNDAKIITTTGRLSQLVAQWLEERQLLRNE